MNVFFDLDGTLTDSAAGITRCIAYALEKLGRPAASDESLRGCLGPPLQATLPKLLGSEDAELAAAALRLYRERFASIGIFENSVYPGVPDVLGELRSSGHRLFVSTSKPTVYAARILDHFDLRQHFAAIYGSELTGERTDKAELLGHILQEQEQCVEAGSCVMVGDRRHDVIGARANGVRSIGALWGYGGEAELVEAGADAICQSPLELPDVLSRLSQRTIVNLRQ